MIKMEKISRLKAFWRKKLPGEPPQVINKGGQNQQIALWTILMGCDQMQVIIWNTEMFCPQESIS